MKSLLTLALLALPLLSACDRASPPAQDPAPTAQPQTAIGRTVAKAMDEARSKLATENIGLNGEFGVSINGDRVGNQGTENLPKAEITPQGDLLIEGKPVVIDDGERKLVQAYRAGIIDVAEAGMDIGVQGADLGMKAAGEAIAGIFTGNTADIEKKIEAESAKIEASARVLCDRLPALLTSQNALAAAVPEFKPYASMDQGDIDDCYRDDKDSGAQAQIREDIRGGIRKAVQGAAQGAGIARSDANTGDAAAEAESASAEHTGSQ